jgi:hypothetical protein
MNRILRIILKLGLGIFGILSFLTFLVVLFISPVLSMVYLAISMICLGGLAVWDRTFRNLLDGIISDFVRKDKQRVERINYENQLRREARIQEEGRLQARENMGYEPEGRRYERTHSQPPSLLDMETKNSSMFLTKGGKLKSETFKDMNRRARGKKKNFDF